VDIPKNGEFQAIWAEECGIVAFSVWKRMLCIDKTGRFRQNDSFIALQHDCARSAVFLFADKTAFPV